MGHRPYRLSRPSLLSALGLLTAGTLLGLPALRAESVRITLADALELAERQNPDLAAARARAGAAAEEAGAARRGAWPHVELSSGWSHTDLPSAAFAHKLDAGQFTSGDFAISRLNDPSALSHLGTAVTVEAPLDAFGKVAAGAGQASARAQSADAMVSEALLDLRFQVAELYRRAVLARDAVRVTEQALASARAREADVEARASGGAVLQADALRARARRREREADLAERRGEAQSAAAALARALGAPAGTLIEPTDAATSPAPLAGDLASWTARALSSRPALARFRAAAEAARWAVRGADKDKLPDLSVWGTLQDNRVGLTDGKRAGALGVNLRWRAFDPARDLRRAARDQEQRAAELDEQAAQDQIRLEVETAWHRAQAARERVAAAAGGAEEGREALRVLRERRQAGMATLTDELETEAASLGAELQELVAIADAAIADAALERAAGGPGEEQHMSSSPSPGGREGDGRGGRGVRSQGEHP